MLKEGIYEHLINNNIDSSIKDSEQREMLCITKEMDSAESSQLLANYLASIIRKRLEDSDSVDDRVSLINRVLREAGIDNNREISEPASLLSEVISREKSILQSDSMVQTVRPLSGFRVSNLFTGGSSTISLGEEIRREIASSDEIYFVVSFLRLSGVRILMDDLRKFCLDRGKRIRIITTTYCGATEAKALEQLSSLPNCEIKISYNTEVERLHAKAYIFVRNSGMNSAYIGSSNLSKSAQTDGLEWNMRVTSVENPHIIKSAMATFDLYWNSANFESFSEGGIDKFRKELNRYSIKDSSIQSIYRHFTILPHQKEILDKLRVEREEYNNWRNLVVAATGTGKTAISAFDYQRFRRDNPRARILFTAHREEILRQALSTYRSVLGDANFGSLWVGNSSPEDVSDYEHLFVSIAMLNNRFKDILSELDPTFYDYIVIDEAHHSQADSYRKIFDHFDPKILIGLTATPERMDNKDLRPDFGGRIGAEIRLPQALQAGLLTPFQYLCVTDSTNLSDESLWSGQKYNIDRLSDKLCSRSRAGLIVDAIRKYLADEYNCCALCFCVNKRHADFMAQELTSYGFKAESLTSDSSDERRHAVVNDLREGRLNYLCVVDIFNEGVDIPEVDSVLFLRPTESLTVFLQQLGRGLRLSANKSELTVLDFVSQVNNKYDFSNRFRALTTNPERSIEKQIKEGFTLLPHGCSIIMEKLARKYILDNISKAIYNKQRIIKEINSYSNSLPTISQFISNNGQDIRILYRGKNCWSSLKRAAGRIDYSDDEITKLLENGISRLLHHNSSSYLHFIKGFVNGDKEYLSPNNRAYALMLYFNIFQNNLNKTGFDSIYDALELLHRSEYSCFKTELGEIVDYLLGNLKIKTQRMEDQEIPNLELYGSYTREEIFIMAGRQTENNNMQGSVTGVFNLDEYNSTILFVTLNKSDEEFSPSTQYNDYIINDKLFHWQSQNRDSHENRGGMKYTEQRSSKRRIILFVREDKKDAFGNTNAFHCFGLVEYKESNGDLPMNITWEVKMPIMAQYLKAI
ncbi:MAG: DUF3427 domain-containing protein [Bacteroidales bacterium]